MEGTSGGDIVLRTAAYSRLTRLQQDLSAGPDLATEWESNDANDEWTFTLTEDAVFSNTDGRSVLAEDVEATINMIMENPDSAAAGNLGAYDSIEIEDDYRFTISLTESDLLYPKKIAEADSRFVILPKNVIEDRRDELSDTDFGSGPFVVDELNEGSTLSFTANEDYHISDEDGNQLPYVDEVTWKLVTDPTAQVSALRDERVDTLQFTPPSQFAQLSNDDGVKTNRRPSTSFISFVLNTTVETESGEKPFENSKVRKAMKHAVDLEGLKGSTDDKLEVMQHGPTTPAHTYYPDFDAGLEFGTTAQTDEAEKLLEEAGYGDGLELPTMYYSADNSPSRGPTSVLFQEQMAEVGIDFEIQKLTGDVWLSDYWNQDGVWYASGYAGRLVDSTVHDLALHSDAPWNSARWENDDYDAAYQRMSEATTTDEYADALAEAQRIHHLEGGWIVSGAEILMSSANDYVRNVKPLPTESIDYHYNDWLTSNAPQGPTPTQ
jgi:peptide/nickel transport system substrate-binding protein